MLVKKNNEQQRLLKRLSFLLLIDKFLFFHAMETERCWFFFVKKYSFSTANIALFSINRIADLFYVSDKQI